MENQTVETRWATIQRNTEARHGTESRAVTALHGIAELYAGCRTIEEVRQVSDALNLHSVSLGAIIASDNGTAKSHLGMAG